MFARTLGLWSIACGGLADGAYLGEPLLTLQGTVVTEGLDVDYSDEPIGVAMLWTLDPGEGGEAQAAVVRTEFPARYSLDLYHPPAISGDLQLLGPDGFRGVVGLPIIYVDADGDGQWDVDGEVVIGGSYDTGVVYSDAIPQWFAGDLPQHGFLPVRFADEPCAVDAELPVALNPQDSGASDLYVGYIWPALSDWDCDGALGEWSGEEWVEDGSCPAADVITHECADLANGLSQADSADDFALLQGILLEDPLWTECLARECPDVIDGIGAGGR